MFKPMDSALEKEKNFGPRYYFIQVDDQEYVLEITRSEKGEYVEIFAKTLDFMAAERHSTYVRHSETPEGLRENILGALSQMEMFANAQVIDVPELTQPMDYTEMIDSLIEQDTNAADTES